MSGPEVFHRVGEQVRRSADRKTRFGWDRFDHVGRVSPFPGLAASIAEMRQALGPVLERSAEEILAGRFSALGVDWPARSPDRLFPSDLWRLDPVTGALWPGADRFSADIEYRHQTSLGSVKYVWEINRLQFLQPLSAHFHLSGDRRALAAVEAAIESWYDANPPFRGISWNSGIELALRAVSLVAAATLCGDALHEGTRGRIHAILAATFHWLGRYPSKFSSANNHLTAEEMGVFLIGALCPGLPKAGSATKAARAILEREALLQILPDGVGAEQSPTYASLTAETFLTAALLARALGSPFSAAFDERIRRFAEAISWFTSSFGQTPSIGDDDEGRVWRTGIGHEPSYPASVSSAAAGYLGLPPLGALSPTIELRDAVFSSPRDKAPQLPMGMKTFPDGGYTVVREVRNGRELHIVLDHGPLGYLSIAAHGHADANALCLSIDGLPVLIDPGTFMYHAEDDWRTWFRGTRAHNSLSVADEDQSQISGPFMWSHRAIGRLEEAAGGEAWRVRASHDGYRKRFGVDHYREVAAQDSGLVVVDRLEPGNLAAPVEVVFQLAPGVSVVQEAGGVRISGPAGPLIFIAFDPPGQLVVAEGCEGYDGGWVSPRFGRKSPAPRLSWRGRLPDQGLRTEITILPSAP